MSAALLAALLLASPACAAAPGDGRATAAAEAGVRMEGAELVEIDGFTGPEGDIPCRVKSFSNAWHYKFHSAGEWLIVNACGDNFINAAKHLPYMKGDEPRKKLPYTLAAPGAVLKKLAADGVFTPEPNPFSRDIQMRASVLPARDGRPEGCYWYVAQGKAKALADCAGENTWKLGGKAQAATKPAAPVALAVKGKDTAGRYARQALDAVPPKAPGAKLVLIEALVDKTGSVKCMAPEDGWSYVFASRTLGGSTFGGCRGKTGLELANFDGKSGGDLSLLDPITLPFKDSDFALAQVPKACREYSTISMKLRNFKPAHAPFSGHSLVWTIDCGSGRHLVDGNTGSYLGPGKK